jgi:hypothetical protein
MASQFELWAIQLDGDRPSPAPGGLPGAAYDSAATFVIPADATVNDPVWLAIDRNSGRMNRVDGVAPADATDGALGFAVIQHRLSQRVAMIRRPDAAAPPAQVNSLPALSLSLLEPGDSIRVAPGRLHYLTERFTPHIGRPTPEMIGKCKCAADGIPIDSDRTSIGTCRCGAVYHNETAADHSDLADNDRLECFGKVRACLVCGRPLTAEPYLVWDPDAL